MRRSSFALWVWVALPVLYHNITNPSLNGPRPRGSIFSTFHENVRNALPIEKSERRRYGGASICQDSVRYMIGIGISAATGLTEEGRGRLPLENVTRVCSVLSRDLGLVFGTVHPITHYPKTTCLPAMHAAAAGL